MVVKIKGKEWSCLNQCKSDCCSELFLPINAEQKNSIKTNRFWIVDNNYSEWRWLKFHKALLIEKLEKGSRKISIKNGVEYEFKHHTLLNQDMVYIVDKCIMLRKDGKCKVYRNRPQICKKAECIVFSDDNIINWYGKNGLLQHKVRDYNLGILKR